MPITTVGHHARINGVDTNANIITTHASSAIHGRLYLANDSGYEIYIGNHDGSLSKISAKASSTSIWAVPGAAGYYQNLQATTDGFVLRRSSGNLSFGLIDNTNITSGYQIPTTTQIANWNAAYSWGQYWKTQPDGKLVPVTYSRIISTNVEDSGYGSIALIPSGTPGDPGILGFYQADGTTVGYIGGVGTRMNYHSSIGNHYFNAAPVQIQTMAVNESVPYLVVTDSNHVLQLKDINSISLFKQEGSSGHIVPKLFNATIATNRDDSGYGGVRFIPGGVGLTGRIEFFRNDNTRTGFIGYDYTDIWYGSDLGNHVFKTGSVVIKNILTDNALTKVLVADTNGVIKYREFNSVITGSNYWTQLNHPISGDPVLRPSTITNGLYVPSATYLTSGFVSYTSDGIFNSNARPLSVVTPSNLSYHLLGYIDNGSGQYAPNYGMQLRNSGTDKRISFGQEEVSGNYHIKTYPDDSTTGTTAFYIDRATNRVGIGNFSSGLLPSNTLHVDGDVKINTLATASSPTHILVEDSNVVKKYAISSLSIPENLWTWDSSFIRPIDGNKTVNIPTNNSGDTVNLQLINTHASGNAVLTFSGGTGGQGYIRTTPNGLKIHTSSLVEITKTDNTAKLAVNRTSADETLHVGGKVKIDTLDTSTTTSYLTEDNGVIKKRSLHVATNSVVGGVRIATGGGLSVDSSGFLSIASWNDYLYATLSSDATKSTPGFSDLLTISLPSAGVWEVKLIGGYSVTSTSNVLGVNFSCTGAVNYMIGSAQAGLTNNPANSETTKVLTASSSGMNINGITVANDTLYVNASYIINVNEPCDIKFQYASPAGGDVTVKQGTSFIAKKLNNYAP